MATVSQTVSQIAAPREPRGLVWMCVPVHWLACTCARAFHDDDDDDDVDDDDDDVDDDDDDDDDDDARAPILVIPYLGSA